MFSKIEKENSKISRTEDVEQLGEALAASEAVVVGAGSGLSSSAGLTYSGERFRKYFSDFIEKYHIPDMYSGGFYPYDSPEEYWAWWSRHIYYNRYIDAPKPVYRELLKLLKNRDYFVLTTNVDHQFQKAGFEKNRLFYTQGDYGLWQCGEPCHRKTYDNEAVVRQMILLQEEMRVPTELIPYCPVCGRPMTMNLRSDNTFVEDDGWQKASDRYSEFLRLHQSKKTLFLELGTGMNTPGIIKYPFWNMTYRWPKATYACINLEDAAAPAEIATRSICIDRDIGDVLKDLLGRIDFLRE